MNTRKQCLLGLAALATVLSGCAAHPGNAGLCVQQMRERLADGAHGTLSVNHRSVSYRARRVVVEGELAGMPGAASAPVAASAPKPTTLVASLEQKLGVKAKPQNTPAAAECTFGDAGLVSFRWLAPAVLAKTTPAP